jgi:hypothetical protein
VPFPRKKRKETLKFLYYTNAVAEAEARIRVRAVSVLILGLGGGPGASVDTAPKKTSAQFKQDEV